MSIEMGFPEIHSCPGTLADGFKTYSSTCLKRVFNGKKVDHILMYESPSATSAYGSVFEENQSRISISGVQEKFSLLLDKNKLRFANEGESGTHILKPIPGNGKRADQMPANEHLTMQIARQVFGIETPENALVFFRNGEPAYITKRFDVKEDGKWAQDDFASLAGRTPQTHGEHYKYAGNYLELFDLMRNDLPAYKMEAPKLFKLLLFNYLFSNGDAHFKNFSIIETALGDYRLSPAYDLLNSRLHIDDNDFALEEGLLPKALAKGKVDRQFALLAEKAGLSDVQCQKIFHGLLSSSSQIERLVNSSYLNEKTKRSYWQLYLTRKKKLMRL
jgi:serine/threonine-protein kinase HipA